MDCFHNCKCSTIFFLISVLHLFNKTSLRIQSIPGQTKNIALNYLVMYWGWESFFLIGKDLIFPQFSHKFITQETQANAMDRVKLALSCVPDYSLYHSWVEIMLWMPLTLPRGVPGGSVVKTLLANSGGTERPRFDPSVGKVPGRRKWQPPPVSSPGKSHGQWSQMGYSPCGLKESDTHTYSANTRQILKCVLNKCINCSVYFKEIL